MLNHGNQRNWSENQSRIKMSTLVVRMEISKNQKRSYILSKDDMTICSLNYRVRLCWTLTWVRRWHFGSLILHLKRLISAFGVCLLNYRIRRWKLYSLVLQFGCNTWWHFGRIFAFPDVSNYVEFSFRQEFLDGKPVLLSPKN